MTEYAAVLYMGVVGLAVREAIRTPEPWLIAVVAAAILALIAVAVLVSRARR